jgi:hypothetical protein
MVGAEMMRDWKHFGDGSFRTPLMALLSYAEIPFRILMKHFGDDGGMPDGDYGDTLAEVLGREIEFVVPRRRMDPLDAAGAYVETLGGTIMRPISTPLA